MKIQPLGNRIVVREEKRKEKVLASGIVMSTAYDKTEEVHGEVLAVGPEVATVKVGDFVSFPMYGYDTVSDLEGQDYMSIREVDVLAVLTK